MSMKDSSVYLDLTATEVKGEPVHIQITAHPMESAALAHTIAYLAIGPAKDLVRSGSVLFMETDGVTLEQIEERLVMLSNDRQFRDILTFHNLDVDGRGRIIAQIEIQPE